MSSSYPVPFTDVARRDRPRRLLVVGVALLLTLAVAGGAAWHPMLTAAARDTATIYFPYEPTSLDPAVQADAGTAQVVSQLFESLTAVDSSAKVQPALAASWTTSDGGKRVVFHLRAGLAFSDGSPLKAGDVVSSWMRVLSPTAPSALAPLLDDVVGARAYREGTGPASAVGIHASGDTDVEVAMSSAASDFPAIASSPTLAVAPSGIGSDPNLLRAGTFVGSGGYVLSDVSSSEMTLTANPHYWAGRPAITTIHLLTSLGGSDPVAEFQAGSIDYTPVQRMDATWIAYDETLGPALRRELSPSTEFFGFNTTRAPFTDVHVRRAFSYGINWRRIVTLISPLAVPATGMVPPGIPGHGTTDYGPKFDIALAKSELAAAGFPNGAGFPKVTLVTTGGEYEDLERAVVQQLHDNLGIAISFKALDGATYNADLLSDPPAFWQMDWVADYPGANDFLGLLLGTGQPNNFAKWSNTDFDAAVTTALTAGDQTAGQAAFDRAQSIVADQVPVIPIDYGSDYSLAASGLLGAVPNSQGLVRYAGLAWASGS